MIRTAKLILVFAHLFSSLLLFAGDTKPALPSYYLGAMGDSLSAATFANTALRQAEAGGKVLGRIENKDSLSWATGNDIQSQFKFLEPILAAQGQKLIPINVAEPGSQTHRMAGQAQKLVDTIQPLIDRGESGGLIYVTYMVGANDVCSERAPEGVPHDIFVTQFKAGLAKLNAIRQASRVRVLVPGIPNLTEFSNPKLLEIKSMFGWTCDRILNQVSNYCKKMTGLMSTQERQVEWNYIRDKNEWLAQIVKDAKSEFPHLDVYFSERITQMDLSPDVLSADCFHPNQHGHESLSMLLWNDLPWSKDWLRARGETISN